jgi:membrane associated rhomboid family serine protease
MGIYDRDYYRKDGGRFYDAWAGGRACTALLAITFGLLLLQVLTQEPRSPGWVTETFQFIPAKVLNGEVWRILGGAFLPMIDTLPFPWVSFIFNLLILWYFGREVEERYGSGEFFTYYVAGALVGTLLQLGMAAAGVAGLRPDSAVACWSGGVTAVLVLYALHHPRQMILVMFLLPVPIWIVVAFQVLKDLPGALASGAAPFGAHLGAAAFALAYFRFDLRLIGWLPKRGAGRPARVRGPKLRVYRDGDTAAAPAVVPAATAVDEALEAKVDALLEKVAQHGQESLSPEEREILFRASELYKKKRKTQ